MKWGVVVAGLVLSCLFIWYFAPFIRLVLFGVLCTGILAFFCVLISGKRAIALEIAPALLILGLLLLRLKVNEPDNSSLEYLTTSAQWIQGRVLGSKGSLDPPQLIFRLEAQGKESLRLPANGVIVVETKNEREMERSSQRFLLTGQWIDSVWKVRDVQPLPEIVGLDSWLGGLRQQALLFLRNSLQILGPSQLGFAQALLLGDRGQMDPQWGRLFRESGLSHLLALSGQHLSLLAGLLLGLLKRRFGIWKSSLVSQVLLLMFCLLAGPLPSLWRALVAFVLSQWARLLGMKVKPMSLWGWSFVALILYEPLWIYHLGFQFSFLAMGGLLLLGPIWSSRLSPWGGSWFGEPLGVSLGASVFSWGLSGYRFGEIHPEGVVLGLFLTPLMGVYLLGSLFLVIFSPLLSVLPPQIGVTLHHAFSIVYQLFTWVLQWGSSVKPLIDGTLWGTLGGTTLFLSWEILYKVRYEQNQLRLTLRYQSTPE